MVPVIAGPHRRGTFPPSQRIRGLTLSRKRTGCRLATEARHAADRALSSGLRFPCGKSMTKTEKLLRELIALPSVNPAFLPAKHPHAGRAAGGGVPGGHGGTGGTRRGIPGRCSGPLQSPGPPLAPRQGAAAAPAGPAHGHGQRRRRTVHARPDERAASLWPRRLRHQRLGGGHADGAVRAGAKRAAAGGDGNRLRGSGGRGARPGRVARPGRERVSGPTWRSSASPRACRW